MGRCMCGADDCKRCRGMGAVSNVLCEVCDHEYTWVELGGFSGKPVPEQDCPSCSQPIDCVECGAELTEDDDGENCAECQAVIDDAQGGE